MKKSFRDAIEVSSLDLPGLGTVTVGLKVKHPVFGRGTVVSIVQWPPYVKQRHSLGVNFETVGRKLLAPGVAKLALDGA
jgi:hypothetical protein